VEQNKIEFGTDGIRGIAGQYPLDPATVLHIGRAIGVWLRQQAGDHARVLIGRDTRKSGHMLLHTLAGGLLAEGINVADAGVVSTPCLAYLARRERFKLGIVISASHNPFDQNGIKLIGPDGFKLDEDSEKAIEALIGAAGASPSATQFGVSSSGLEKSILHYIAYLGSSCREEPLDNLTLVVDGANGAISGIVADAFRLAGAWQLVSQNCTPDGININVRAGSEYVRRDRTAMLEAVRANNADLGIAFDGDADRVVFVTPEGMLVDGDHVLGILALELKAQDRLTGNTVVATEMSNSGLEHFLKEQGITLSRTKVGDRYVMDRMRQNGFVLGGEQAGHIILLDGDHTTGDGLFIGLMVASLVARNKRSEGPTLHELAARIPRYPQLIASAHLDRQVDLSGVPGLADQQRQTLALFDNMGRVNMRFSGTEPNLLRTMVEGGPHTTMAQVVEQALALSGLVAQAAGTAKPPIDIVDCATGAPVET
jgi:phosphoglucosamine mutase